MARLDPDLRRTWLFGSAVEPMVHAAMLGSGADVLIADLEDFTPPARRDEARHLLPSALQRWRESGRVAVVRINPLEAEGTADLAAVMPARPDIVAYPMTVSAVQMQALDLALERWESSLGIAKGATEMLPVCETALGVVNVRDIVRASGRIRCALLGAEDLAADLCAERHPDAMELEHARQRFLLECRATAVEPVDAPYTFADAEGAVREARRSRGLGYRCKSLVRPEHAAALNEALTPSADEGERASSIVSAFEAARARGEDRVLVGGLWIEVPTYLNARRLLERARRLARNGT